MYKTIFNRKMRESDQIGKAQSSLCPAFSDLFPPCQPFPWSQASPQPALLLFCWCICFVTPRSVVSISLSQRPLRVVALSCFHILLAWSVVASCSARAFLSQSWEPSGWPGRDLGSPSDSPGLRRGLCCFLAL